MVRSLSPAGSASMRASNLALVFGWIADHGPLSRAELAVQTGLTKATVSTLVDLLLGGGLVDDLGTVPNPTAGRPRSLIGLSASGPVGIGMEINVDYLAAWTVDLVGNVRRRELVLDDLRNVDANDVLRRAALMLRRAIDQASSDGLRVAGIDIAVPGLVDVSRQVLRLAPNLGWRDLPVLDSIRKLGGIEDVPLRLDNEGNYAALGEMWSGNHRDLQNFLILFGEIGVGAGIVVDGEVYRGSSGFAGEIGHANLYPDGVPCPCGSRGCLERYAGQEHLLRQAGIQLSPGTTIGRPEGAMAELVHRAEDGNEQALAAITEVGIAIGTVLASVLNVLDIDTVILGGIYGAIATWLEPVVQVELSRRILSAPWSSPKVTSSRNGGEIAVVGAARSAVRRVIHDPTTYLRQ